ncbi:MAG: ribonuclease domain-containing protein [Bulleidia sp.]|nr:ribonuclease domain-containing protein [Bulleidia sp.]
MKNMKKYLAVLASLVLFGCGRTKTSSIAAVSPEPTKEPLAVITAAPEATEKSTAEPAAEVTASAEPYETAEAAIPEDTQCDDKACVALYLETYEHLPDNYMTKKEARTYGWEGGALHLVVEGMCIGGDEYSNFEGTLPEAKGRQYYECDIDTLKSKKRGTKRIVYSDDGLIYYTDDHYETFELLYGEE